MLYIYSIIVKVFVIMITANSSILRVCGYNAIVYLFYVRLVKIL